MGTPTDCLASVGAAHRRMQRIGRKRRLPPGDGFIICYPCSIFESPKSCDIQTISTILEEFPEVMTLARSVLFLPLSFFA
jgi:hypothetical protein